MGLFEAISYIINKTQDHNVEFVENIAWLLSNITRGDPYADFDKIKQFIPYLIQLLQSSDIGILKDTLWGLANICGSSDEAAK